MNKTEIRETIISEAKKNGITEIEQITAMQGVLAKDIEPNLVKVLDILCEIKMEYIDKML